MGGPTMFGSCKVGTSSERGAGTCESERIAEACRQSHTSCFIDVDPALLAAPRFLQDLERLKYKIVRMDHPVHDRRQLLASITRAFRLPDGVNNWQDLEEHLCEIAWSDERLRGCMILCLRPLLLGWADLFS